MFQTHRPGCTIQLAPYPPSVPAMQRHTPALYPHLVRVGRKRGRTSNPPEILCGCSLAASQQLVAAYSRSVLHTT
eukprot:506405-Rhodomonas_salina.2